MQFIESYEHDLDLTPHKYLIYMMKMNELIEKNNGKTFQPICLRTDIKNKYVTINTNALIDIIPTLKNKNGYLKNVQKYQKDLWDLSFNKGCNNKFKMKNHVFNYQIQTNGYAVSLNFIHKNEVEKKQKQKKRN